MEKSKRYEKFFRTIFDDFQLFPLNFISFQELFSTMFSKCSEAVCGCLCGQQIEARWSIPTSL